jgi:adenosylcobinamide kinase / adenosylcobinamide-phosphate guanylyltransferase
MAAIILITGGSRSGKSAYAQRIAESRPGERIYIATCPVIDEEMAERIRKHKQARKQGWQTIEETENLVAALRSAKEAETILVDCLTLWINNLMYSTESVNAGLTEEDVTARCLEVLDACKNLSGTIIFVTNETGMGIVPADPQSRLFRDLAGRCNQIMADGADTVILMISGIAVTIKGDISI